MRRPATQRGWKPRTVQDWVSTGAQAGGCSRGAHRAPGPQSVGRTYPASGRQASRRPFSQLGSTSPSTQGSAKAGTHWGTGASEAQRSAPQGVSTTPPSGPQLKSVLRSQLVPSAPQGPASSWGCTQAAPSPHRQPARASARPTDAAAVRRGAKAANLPDPMNSPPALIDSHAHLDGEKFRADLPEVLERARLAGVVAIVTIGVDLDSSLRARALATEHPQLFASAGVHPHDAARFDDADWPRLCALFDEPRIVAVGEAGLDYFYDFSPRERQQAVFRRQLELSGEVGRPVVIHVRDAYDDAFALMAEVGLPAGGVLHCFTGGPAECERALALGLHVSIPGIVTFKNGDSIRAAVPLIPDDRLLVETDSPYLAPIPHRGRRNEPAFVAATAAKVAEIRGVPLAALADLTRRNTVRLFGLPASLGAPAEG